MSNTSSLDTDSITGRVRLSRAVRSFTAAWSYPLLRSKRTVFGLFALIVALCGVRAFLGLIDSRQYSHDVFMFLDGAWRMLNGQRPHIDFYSHLGFLTYLPTVIGLKLSGGTAWGMAFGHALVGLLLGVWSYMLGRRRLADVPLALFCLCLTFLAVSPFALGEPLLQISYVMTYNRFGYAFLALLLLESFVEPADFTRDSRAGLSTGAIIALLLFLKITYFVFAVFLVFALIPCRRQSRARWIGIAIGFLLVAVACASYYSFHLLPMVRDLRTIAGAKHIRIRSYMLDEIFVRALGAVVFAIAAALLLLNGNRRSRALPVTFLGVLVAVTGAALILGNYEESGFPLGVFLALLALNELLEPEPPGDLTPDYFRFTVMSLGTVFVAGALFSGTISTAAALAGRVYTVRKMPPLQSPILRGFIPAGDDSWFAGIVDDGLSLVRKLKRPGDTLMCLDFTNPFSYGLAMQPAPGGATVLQYKTTFDDTHRQSAEYLFGAAKLVAVPQQFTDPTLVNSIDALYGHYLNAHFHLVGVSRHWLLYRHNE